MTQWLIEEAAFLALDRAEHAAVEKAEQPAATSTHAHLVAAATRMVQQARR